MSCKPNVNYASYDEYPVYNGDDLELTYTAQESGFRVWAPTADEVKLLLYAHGHEGSAYEIRSMNRDVDGTWTEKIKTDLKGKFYTFQIRIGEKWHDETPGMWVKATGVNGKRAAIIDMNDTNPEG